MSSPTIKMTEQTAGVWERLWEEDPLGCDDAQVDRTTRVVWTQTPCGIYVDLRLPEGAPGRNPRQKHPEYILGIDPGDYTEDECKLILQQKSFAGRLECFVGDTTDGTALIKDKILADLVKANAGPLPLCTCFWKREIDYQPPTGGLDIGVCASSPLNSDGSLDLRETGDDASYAEGWRREAGTSDGPFVALELVDSTRKGFWVRVGNRFAFAVGRSEADDAIVSKIKECKGMSLYEAVSSLNLGSKQQEIAAALSYVAVIGEVQGDGKWRIDAATTPDLVGCALIASDPQAPYCCSTLTIPSNVESNTVEEGMMLNQVIPSRHAENGGDEIRKWKVVELSFPAALPVNART